MAQHTYLWIPMALFGLDRMLMLCLGELENKLIGLHFREYSLC